MILGIDAFNISSGGGVTHLVELLRAADPLKHGFTKVVVWSSKSTLSRIENRDWLVKAFDPLLDRSLLYRVFWEKFRIRRLAEKIGCSVLFVPGGSGASGFIPSVSMSQNLLPFEWRELIRYGWSLMTIKFLILRFSQKLSFRNASGVIFLSDYARTTVLNVTGPLRGKTTTIPHGINPRFFSLPKPQRCFDEFCPTKPCRLLYVSIVESYKHQWHLVEAVALIRSDGIPITLELVGPESTGMKRLQNTIRRVDPNREFIFYRGMVSHEELNSVYAQADIGVFASSCENMPNILIEGMASGLPMACSDRGPMPEVLGEAGLYFNPEVPDTIADVLRNLMKSRCLRQKLAQLAFQRAQHFSWERCAEETFDFFARIAKDTHCRSE